MIESPTPKNKLKNMMRKVGMAYLTVAGFFVLWGGIILVVLLFNTSDEPTGLKTYRFMANGAYRYTYSFMPYLGYMFALAFLSFIVGLSWHRVTKGKKKIK